MFSVGIIGCGRISYKHIEGLIKNRNKVFLAAVCDIDKAKAIKRAEEYIAQVEGLTVNVYTDYIEMLNAENIDIVTIATESGYHSEIAIACLEAGCHVICEKPMALSTEEADQMIATADRVGKKLSVCFQNRFNAPVVKLREALTLGRFGSNLHGSIQVRWNRMNDYYQQALWRGTWELDGGTLMNQCTHGIDLLQWMMLSNVKRIHGVTRRFQKPIEAEDFGAAILEFDNNSVGMIEGSANVYPKNLDETLSIFGERGSVVIGGLAVNKILTWRFSDAESFGDFEEKVLDPNEKDPPTVYGFGHSALFADVIDSIERNREPVVSGREGRKAMDIILGIYKSMKIGQAVDMPISFSTKEMKGIFK